MEFWRRKKEKGKARKCFLKNGSMFLQKLIADCNGISNPIKMFSSDQISKATNHFDPKSYVIKRITKKAGVEGEERAYNDIVLSARVSNHSGFHKLVGCCLEFPFPVLVFEDLEYTSLNIRGSVGSEDAPVLPWDVRLKIAKDVATAITYLQTAFPRMIIHRNIKPTNVFLDKNGTAKLTALSLALTLPEGKTWAEDAVVGTYGYGEPIYFTTGILTEYSDVFSFGILMLILLLGRPLRSDGSDGHLYNNILDYVKDLRERGEPVEFGGGSNDMSPGQMNMFLDLALRCCEERNEDRPKMILVAKEIKLIEQASL
ncbi:Protein kinase superfamily protein [Raphanus sativus]|nr:Protein kinase superfamily protein [Raphanus sativus]